MSQHLRDWKTALSTSSFQALLIDWVAHERKTFRGWQTLENSIIMVSSLKALPMTSALVAAARGTRTSRMKHSSPHSASA